MYLQACSWRQIIEFYAHLITNGWSYQPMHDLVQRLTASPYIVKPSITVLFPATSLDVLLIAATERFCWKTEVLEIQYLPSSQTFQFDFWESPFIKQHWQRTSAILNSFAVLERFLHLKHWA